MNLTLREQERIAYANGDTATLQALAVAEQLAEERSDALESAEVRRLESELDDAEAEREDEANRRIEMEDAVERIETRLSDHDDGLTAEQVKALAEVLRKLESMEDSDLDAIFG